MECAHISAHALDGYDVFETLRITGLCGRKSVNILMDTGSTHNFMDVEVAKRLGCYLLDRAPMTVKVADGGKLKCTQMVRGFEWKIKGVTFITDVYRMPLGGCDLVLGVQWFSTLGDIQLNYQNYTMSFYYMNQKVSLRGAKKVSSMLKGSLQKEVQLGSELSLMQLTSIDGQDTSPKECALITGN